MKGIERFIEAIILGSRWLLVFFYLGLAAALACYAVTFATKLYEFASHALSVEESESILKILGLIDAALVASLIVMVIISGYENFVSRFDEGENELAWLGKIDASSLKVKVASTIVAISAIHLLQAFLNASGHTQNELMWLTIMHVVFVFSALFLAYIDKIMSHGDSGPDKGKGGH